MPLTEPRHESFYRKRRETPLKKLKAKIEAQIETHDTTLEFRKKYDKCQANFILQAQTDVLKWVLSELEKMNPAPEARGSRKNDEKPKHRFIRKNLGSLALYVAEKEKIEGAK